MASPLFYPQVTYGSFVQNQGDVVLNLKKLCKYNNVVCKYSGPLLKRKIILSKSTHKAIVMNPSNQTVCVKIPYRLRSKKSYHYVLCVMAYAVFDLAARQSVFKNPAFCKVQIVGRPRKGRTLSNAERQARFRSKS